jgi:hypothetical protein
MDLVTVLCLSEASAVTIYVFRFWIKGLWLWEWNRRLAKKGGDYVGPIAICSRKRRGDLVHIRPGKCKGRRDRHSRNVVNALLHYQHQPWLPGVRFYYKQKLRNLSERGHWHDLTDSRWRIVQYVVACQRAGLKDGTGLGNGGNTHYPSPDLALSNFDTGHIVYRTQNGAIDLENAEGKIAHFENVWGCKVVIEPYEDIPGAILVRPAKKMDPRPRPAALGVEASDDLPFGRDRLTGEEIAFDLRKLQKRTHIAVIAGSGSGKSNLIGCFLGWFAQKARERRPDPLIGKIRLIDPTGAAGFGCYEKMGVIISCDEDEIIKAAQEIVKTYEDRKKQMIADGIPWWTGPIDVVIFDELSQLPREQTEIIAGWAKEFRKRGILLMFFSQRMRDKAGVPLDIPSNCAIKIALPVEEQRDATEFLKINEYKPGFEPGVLEPGQFIMKYPGQGFFYGQADLATHEQIAEAAE